MPFARPSPLRRMATTAILALCAFALAAERRAAGYAGDLLFQMPNPSPDSNDQFGVAIAAANGNILVGAPGDDTGGLNNGRAYLFNGNTGVLMRILDDPTTGTGDQFGFAVAAIGGLLAIGAPADSADAPSGGAVHIFDAATGAYLRTLRDPSAASSEFFGFSLAAVGNNLLVGAPNGIVFTVAAGFARLYDPSTGAFLRQFDNPTPQAGDKFGYAMTEVGPNLAITAPYDSDLGFDTGAAYVFNASGGQLARLVTPELDLSDRFGTSIASQGGKVLVGSPYHYYGAFESGSVYAFDGVTGAPRFILRDPDPHDFDYFGRSIAGVGDFILAGAYQAQEGGVSVGKAYAFNGATGAEVLAIDDPAAGELDDFGLAVAGLGQNFVVGAPYDDLAGADSGRVYLFRGFPPLSFNAARFWEGYE